ncbi:putative F-box protein [Salvia divinorum]|uniref:F-box protein n=1 Tax=Salvia divinorum TaxID=28513 RepID=A0ABD1FNM4_SALDI
MLFHSRLPRVSDHRELGKKKTRKRQRNMDSNSDKVGKKRKVAGEDRVSDRISELPESIAHHIFNFLRCPKDVARTTVLSKNWKRVFDSYQSFHFDQRWFKTQVGIFETDEWKKKKSRREDWEKFKGFVTNALATRLDRLECADKFRLYANDVDIPFMQPMQSITEWIRAAIAKNVKELDVCAGTYQDDAVPIGLSESSSITFLKVTGSSLYGLASLKMCNLRGILIREAMYFDAKFVKRLEENCPLLEDLRIVGCSHLPYLQISSLVKLRRVEVHDCPLAKRIEITAPNLETFWFNGKNNLKYKIRLKCTENLRNLTLMGSGMTDSAFENHISMSPLLEKLEIRNCTTIEKIRICSQTLKSLTLIKCYMLNEVDVIAPYLHSFEYQGRGRFFPLFNAPRLSQVKLSPSSCNKRSDASCERFSWDLNGSKAGFKLIRYTKKTMKIFEKAEEKDLWQARACRIELIASTSKVVKTVDNWLRENHGKSLSLVSSPEGELLELINTLIMEREDSPSCCRFYSNKCWRHYIEDVKASRMECARRKTSYDFTWTPKIKKSGVE